MRVLIFLISMAISLKVIAQSNFDPEAAFGGLTVHKLSYGLVSCKPGPGAALGSAKAELYWSINNEGKIDSIDFTGLDDHSGFGRTFISIFPFGRNYDTIKALLTPTGLKVDVYNGAGSLRASQELIFSFGINKIQYKQKFYETGSVLDCTYERESRH